jgi:hypothetical protein
MRTALAGTVAPLLAARLAAGSGLTAARALAVVAVAALWIGAMTVCHRRIRALTSTGPVRASRAPAVLAMIVVGCALLGAFIVGGLRHG